MTDEQAEAEAAELAGNDPPAYEWHRQQVEPPASPHPHAVTRWLTGGEVPVIVTRQHVVRLLPPAAALAGALIAASWASLATPDPGPIWLAFAAVALWSTWRWLDWRQCWIIVTPKRIMSVYGLGRLRLEQLPLDKLRDVDLTQTLPGRLFGYGTFEFSSIATGHSLQEVEFVPWPVETHVEITSLITQRGG